MDKKKPTVLIVEDDFDLADMLGAYLASRGFNVVKVHLGEEALTACQSQRPDLIILDIRLPDIDGYEVAARLRNSNRMKNIPIIFLTDKRSRPDRLQGLEIGADDYVTKPFDIQELRLRVRNAISRAGEGYLTNPVTGLPEGPLIDERLNECIESRDWAVILVSILNLDYFREKYGFVAGDDVLRAVSLIIDKSVGLAGNPKDFIGQFSDTQFILVTTQDRSSSLVLRIHSRVEESLDFFYPSNEIERLSYRPNQLAVQVKQLLASERRWLDLDSLKSHLAKMKT